MKMSFGDAMRNGLHASESGRKPQHPRVRTCVYAPLVRRSRAGRAPVRPGELAREVRAQAGRLGTQEIEVGEARFAAGDQVITRINDQAAGIYNRERCSCRILPEAEGFWAWTWAGDRPVARPDPLSSRIAQ